MSESTAPAGGDARGIELQRRLAGVRDRIDAAATAAGREVGEIELLVITKFFPADDVARLIDLGVSHFGESREPEAGRKVAEVAALRPGHPARFDMVGGLQRRKTKTVARWADRVHSVDRDVLVDGLGTAAATALAEGVRDRPLEVLLQLSLDGDPDRGGVVAEALPELADQVIGTDSLCLAGLMVIIPIGGEVDRWFAEAAAAREDFLTRYPAAATFSAGMSGDLESAIAHGSTCVRVGTAIMGERPILSP